ncbi:spinster family MFS transporter [Novosphingobium terrae]|uniref:spinster family MFS transporter n=1 Tax=Novosphingobium terrae TaxID=2726189 RepID=UPI001980DECA|nr:MFS transporter [Novosphingobium terrae]
MFRQADPVAMPVESRASLAALPAPGMRMALYVLLLMSLISLIGSYDRYLVGILVESIKHDLKVSDGQVGLLTGLGFALVYSLLAVPVARLSDGGRRVPVLACALILWSIMTALCGAAIGFPMLLLARMGVGVGEAGCVPTTQAILSDHFPERWRATAIAIATVASGIGLMLAGVCGGWVADHWGWRAAFLVGAVPGPALAWLLWATLRKPVAGKTSLEAPTLPMTMPNAVGTLLRVRSLRLIYLGYSLATMAAYAAIGWIPAFLMRSQGLSASQVGAGYGSINGITMIVALFAGGLLGDMLGRRDRRWVIWQMAGCCILACPVTVVFLLSHDLHMMLWLTVPMTLLAMGSGSTVYATIQDLAGPRLRATGSALFLLFFNLAGVGIGPSLVGWLSDALHGRFGGDALRMALVGISFTYVLGGLIILLALPSIRRDMTEASQRGAPSID